MKKYMPLLLMVLLLLASCAKKAKDPVPLYSTINVEITNAQDYETIISQEVNTKVTELYDDAPASGSITLQFKVPIGAEFFVELSSNPDNPPNNTPVLNVTDNGVAVNTISNTDADFIVQ